MGISKISYICNSSAMGRKLWLTKKKTKMKLKVDKRFVRAGEIVTVRWDAEDGNSLCLVLHNGDREVMLNVPPSGEKQFRMKGKKGMHWIGLKARVGNVEKMKRHHFLVYGTAKTTDDFEYMDHEDTTLGRMQRNMRLWWNSFPPEKKRMYILLLLLMLYQFLAVSMPQLAGILLYAIIFWLFWQVIKR